MTVVKFLLSLFNFALAERLIVEKCIDGLELFAEFKEVNRMQIAEILGVSAQSTRALLRQWIAEGFLRYANESKKARTYLFLFSVI